ncbi:MAG: DegV family protein [Ruminococcaceae bacterium]|nr:DegV family protein [Oscillospiraceae bacterium]
MSQYQIITDSGCDLPKAMLEQLGIRTVPLTVNFREETRGDSVDEGMSELYAALRAGEVATTSAINPDRWVQEMLPYLESGADLLVITFSSGLSATYQSAVIAADELKETYPQRKIFVVDSLSASLGQGLLVWYACQKKQEGLSLEELASWTEENRMHLCHWFTVDDLMYLKRGGRVSATTALVGTMLQIKPVLHMDDEGHLINMSKTRGRKASIEALAEKAVQLGAGYENHTMFICHGDCLEDARYLETLVKEKCGVKEVLIGYTGTVIGSHSGPGTLALFFMGKNR